MNTDILGIRPPEAPCFPTHVQYSGKNAFLSPPEVEAVRTLCDSLQLHPGTIGNGGTSSDSKHVPSYRTVETTAVPSERARWLYTRVLERISWVNKDCYRFTLSGLSEPIGYLKYSAADGDKPAGHYGWHQDFGGGLFATRKLSMVIQLSDPSEYDGCRLQLCNDGPWEAPYTQAGDAIIFPSWTPHCVTNITRGVRRALVIWVAGPQFQ